MMSSGGGPPRIPPPVVREGLFVPTQDHNKISIVQRSDRKITTATIGLHTDQTRESTYSAKKARSSKKKPQRIS